MWVHSWCSSVINSSIPSSRQNSSVTALNATQMDVEDSWSAFAPVAFDAVVLFHVPDPVQPQQSQTSLSSQAATVPSSSALSLSTPSSFDSSPTCSQVVRSSPSVLIDIRDSTCTFFYFHRLLRPKGSVERDQISGLTPCLGLLMILLSFVRSKLCRRVGFLLLRNLGKTSVSGFFFPIA